MTSVKNDYFTRVKPIRVNVEIFDQFIAKCQGIKMIGGQPDQYQCFKLDEHDDQSSPA